MSKVITVEAAVSQLQGMFSEMDREVLLTVLECNGRNLNATIEQLLKMSNSDSTSQNNNNSNLDPNVRKVMTTHLEGEYSFCSKSFCVEQRIFESKRGTNGPRRTVGT